MSRNLQPLSNRMSAAAGSTLAQVKTQQLAREEDAKLRQRRLKGILVLVEQFLLEQGYQNALQQLQQESNITLQQYAAADNIDLVGLVSEFEQFYEIKYQRKPKLFRSRDGSEETVKVVTQGGEKMLVRPTGGSGSAPTTTAGSRSGGGGKTAPAAASATVSPSYASVGSTPEASPPAHLAESRPRPAGGIQRALLASKKGKKDSQDRSGDRANDDGGLDALNLAGHKVDVSASTSAGAGHAEEENEFFGRALKPMPVFATHDQNELAGAIMRDILDVNPTVHWTDIAELEHAKHLLKEAVVMPVKYPELFEGIVRPWKGILLFGPPGTGKTLLAKAVATECRTTFFNISASSVVSKWRGDSEKLIRMLFDLAVHYSPSTVFIDEVDSIMSARSSEGEHEGSRRMKTELLTQMDGLSKRRGGEVVFVLAASNVPWDLDMAMLRRLEKRILVTLPTATARADMLRHLLADRVEEAAVFDWMRCAELAENMSGADIDIACREAMMRPIRKWIEKLEKAPAAAGAGAGRGRRPSDDLSQIACRKPSVTLEDVEASIAATRSSVRTEDLKKYADWAAKYGSGMSA